MDPESILLITMVKRQKGYKKYKKRLRELTHAQRKTRAVTHTYTHTHTHTE
jgi:hypothetical protein